ncbi:MAG: DoxX family membrane protein [Bdellovibrionaceae bacterium]|nr:DoxX family membrane protein [Pseudobdellovibrionaceae bacterium]
MEWLELGARWILGLQFLFWGANGFFHWIAIPPSSDFINRFTNVCIESKFIMPVVKSFEIIFGALLLTGYGTQIALIFLGPIVFMISALHIVHNKKWSLAVLPILIPFLVTLVLHGSSLQVLLH